MALLTLDTWSWIGIAAAAWCAFSFGFAFWLGRAIRMSESSMEAPSAHQQPGYRSGVLRDPRQLHAPAEESPFGETEEARQDETRRSGVRLSAIQGDEDGQATSRRRDATGSH